MDGDRGEASPPNVPMKAYMKVDAQPSSASAPATVRGHQPLQARRHSAHSTVRDCDERQQRSLLEAGNIARGAGCGHCAAIGTVSPTNFFESDIAAFRSRPCQFRSG